MPPAKFDRRKRAEPVRAASVLPSNHTFVTSSRHTLPPIARSATPQASEAPPALRGPAQRALPAEAIRTVDVKCVRLRNQAGAAVPIPAQPFGPNTPFFRTRALLGADHEQLTSPTAPQNPVVQNANQPRAVAYKSHHFVGSDSDDDSTTPPLPPGNAVFSMPSELADGIRGVALHRLHLLWYPRVLRYRRRKLLARDSAATLRHSVRVTPDFLKKNALFADWNGEALTILISKLTFSCGDFRRTPLFRGEPPGSQICFVTSGTYDLIATEVTTSGKPKRQTIVGRGTAPSVVNEHTFLSAEPRISTLRLAPRAELWTCDRAGFESAMAALTPDVRGSVLERATAKRVRDLPRVFPVNAQFLRAFGPFSQTSTPFLSHIAASCRPVCYPAGTLLGAASPGAAPLANAPSALILILRGECGVFRNFTMPGHTGGSSSRRNSVVCGGSEVHRSLVCRTKGFFLVNEGSALFRVPPTHPNEFVESLSIVDGYSVDVEEIDRALAAHPADRQLLATHSQRRLLHVLSAQMRHYRSSLQAIPLVGKRIPSAAFDALLNLFEARVYQPLAVICGSSDQVDRLIILTKGKARIGPARHSQHLVLKQPIGYTGIVPHRWAAPVVALTASETIELPMQLFAAFLEDCGLLREAKCVFRALMFPDATFPAEFDESVKSARCDEELRATPVMYPVYLGVVEPSRYLIGMVPHAAPETDILGGMGRVLGPTRLSVDERRVIEEQELAQFIPTNNRKLTKVTGFLWLKQRPQFP